MWNLNLLLTFRLNQGKAFFLPSRKFNPQPRILTSVNLLKTQHFLFSFIWTKNFFNSRNSTSEMFRFSETNMHIPAFQVLHLSNFSHILLFLRNSFCMTEKYWNRFCKISLSFVKCRRSSTKKNKEANFSIHSRLKKKIYLDLIIFCQTLSAKKTMNITLTHKWNLWQGLSL